MGLEYIRNDGKYKQLCCEERGKIEAYLTLKYSISKILANKLLNCKSYFCNAYHSWEKGSIENRNKILRQFFPKGTNFDLISEDEILRVQNVINNRPMKALNWHSPADVFLRLRSGY